MDDTITPCGTLGGPVIKGRGGGGRGKGEGEGERGEICNTNIIHTMHTYIHTYTHTLCSYT